jgi:secreted Zn-dependent insulinase-like peptidase
MLNEYLREFNYKANCANMNLEISPLYDSLSLQWSGFNHTMPEYISQSIDHILKMQEES